MKRMLAALVAMSVFSVSRHGSSAEPADTTAIVAFTGADSAVLERTYHRIVSEQDWIRIWQSHKGQKAGDACDLFYNPLGLPFVDFERYMVVAIFQGGGWNSAGLKALSIAEESDRIVFRFDDKSYQTGRCATKVSVYGFFVVPRSAKSVVLEENVQSLIGKPPEWKERHSFPKL